MGLLACEVFGEQLPDAAHHHGELQDLCGLGLLAELLAVALLDVLLRDLLEPIAERPVLKARLGKVRDRVRVRVGVGVR